MKNFVKKAVSFASGLCAGLSANKSTAVLRTDKTVRDPYILLAGNTYYMYGTGLSWPGYGCSTSEDLVHWTQNKTVFTPPGNFDGDGDFWAPECHFYKGNYYLFATYHSKASGKRGVGIFRSASPEGPFELISDGHITPKEHDAIDGTLFVDDSGAPWMVFVNEWTSNSDKIGDMAIARLSDDLTHFISKPKIIFRAKDAIWAVDGITDGPWLYKTSKGRLIMLWSNFTDNGYVVGIAYSSNGKIDGRWRQQPITLYESGKKGCSEDGGHGMLFTDKNGQLTLSIHSPNGSRDDCPTTAVFIPVKDTGDTLTLRDGVSAKESFLLKAYYFFADILNHVFN